VNTSEKNQKLIDLRDIANQALRFGVYTPRLVAMQNDTKRDVRFKQGTLYLRWLKTLEAAERREYQLGLARASESYQGKKTNEKDFADVIGSLIFAGEFEGIKAVTHADLPKLVLTAIDLIHQVFELSRELVLVIPENSLVIRYIQDWSETNQCMRRMMYADLSNIARKSVK
jgi:hypothetical protein